MSRLTRVRAASCAERRSWPCAGLHRHPGVQPAGADAVCLPEHLLWRLPHNVRFGQGIAAGLLANGLAAMFTSLLGTGTTLLMLRSPWLLHWFIHGRHLTAIATYRYELHTANYAGGYGLMLMFFPVIGLLMSFLASGIANLPRRASGPRPGNGGGGGGPEPEPEPPGGERPEADRVPVLVLSSYGE